MEQKSILVIFFFLFSLNIFSQNNLPQKKINCWRCKGTGVIRAMVTCNNCNDWNLEYRSKVACKVCKDTRQVFGQKVKCQRLMGGCGGKGFYIINNIPEKLENIFSGLFNYGGRVGYHNMNSETYKFWSSAKVTLPNSSFIRFDFNDLYFDFYNNDNIVIVNKKNYKTLKGIYGCNSTEGWAVRIGEDDYLLYQMESGRFDFGLEKLLIDASN